MTTFQYLVEAFIGTLASVLPIPRSLNRDFTTQVLHWSEPPTELLMLSVCTVALYLLYLFRYDFLGMISAVLKSILKPASLGTEQRTLDQHTLLFVLIVFPLAYLGSFYLGTELENAQLEILKSPITHAATYLAVAFGFHFSKNWNKRIKGLNHIKLRDGFLIGALSLLITYDPISWIAILWIGFALSNYHFEAIFKYSYMLIGLMTAVQAWTMLKAIAPLEAIRHVGYLNSIAVIAVSLTTIYMLMEHLQRTISEATYKNSRNWCILCALFYGILTFL